MAAVFLLLTALIHLVASCPQHIPANNPNAVAPEAIERLLHRRNNAVLAQAQLSSPGTSLTLVDADDDASVYLASYMWTIDAYEKRKERRLDSSVFRAATLWQLIFYPHGDDGHKGYISLYIGATLAPHWGPQEAVYSSWRFTVMNARGKRPHIVQEAQHNFTRFSTNWGFNKLTLRRSLLDPSEGWLDKNGHLMLRVDVRQVVPYWAEYRGIERQHYDTVRSSVALWSEMQNLGVKDLMVTYSITEDGQSKVGYNFKGQFYSSAAELRTVLEAQSEALRVFFTSNAAASAGAAVAGDAATAKRAAGAANSDWSGCGTGDPPPVPAKARSRGASCAGDGGKGAAASPACATRSGGAAAGGLTDAIAAASASPKASAAAADRYNTLFSMRPGLGAGADASHAGGSLATGAQSDDGASSGLINVLAGRLSWLLGSYVTPPVAVGGVAYLVVAVTLQLWRWLWAALHTTKGGPAAEGSGGGGSTKLRSAGGCKNGAKMRPAKAKPRAGVTPSPPAGSVVRATAATATGPAAHGGCQPSATPPAAHPHGGATVQSRRALSYVVQSSAPANPQQEEAHTPVDGELPGATRAATRTSSAAGGSGARGSMPGNTGKAATRISAPDIGVAASSGLPLAEAAKQSRQQKQAGPAGPAAPRAAAASPTASAATPAAQARDCEEAPKEVITARPPVPKDPAAGSSPVVTCPHPSDCTVDLRFCPERLSCTSAVPGPVAALPEDPAASARPEFRSCLSAPRTSGSPQLPHADTVGALDLPARRACSEVAANGIGAAGPGVLSPSSVAVASSALGPSRRTAGDVSCSSRLAALRPLPIGPVNTWKPALSVCGPFDNPAPLEPLSSPPTCASPLVQAFGFGDPLWQVAPLSPCHQKQRQLPAAESCSTAGLGPGSELSASLQPFFDRHLRQRLSLSCGGFGTRSASTSVKAGGLLSASFSVPPALRGHIASSLPEEAGGHDNDSEDDELNSSLPLLVANSLLDAVAREDDRQELERRGRSTGGGSDGGCSGGAAVSCAGSGGSAEDPRIIKVVAQRHGKRREETAPAMKPDPTAAQPEQAANGAAPQSADPANGPAVDSGPALAASLQHNAGAAAKVRRRGAVELPGEQSKGKGKSKPRPQVAGKPLQPSAKGRSAEDAGGSTRAAQDSATPLVLPTEADVARGGAPGTEAGQDVTGAQADASRCASPSLLRPWNGGLGSAATVGGCTAPAASQRPSLLQSLRWLFARQAALLLTAIARCLLSLAASLLAYDHDQGATAAGTAVLGATPPLQAVAPAAGPADSGGTGPGAEGSGAEGGLSRDDSADDCGGGSECPVSASNSGSSGEAGQGSCTTSVACSSCVADIKDGSAGTDVEPALASSVPNMRPAEHSAKAVEARGGQDPSAWLSQPNLDAGPASTGPRGNIFALPRPSFLLPSLPESLRLAAASDAPTLPLTASDAGSASDATDRLARGAWDAWGIGAGAGGGVLSGSPLCDGAGLWPNPWSQQSQMPFGGTGLASLGSPLGPTWQARKEEPLCKVCCLRPAGVVFVHGDGVCLAACAGCAPGLAAGSEPACCPLCLEPAASVLTVRTFPVIK